MGTDPRHQPRPSITLIASTALKAHKMSKSVFGQL